ncbi:Methyltransferase domain-containing protein [Rhizobiales bacterium GAS113]|nr:Methyltransferase domain-containing protein [Rhizobiales bacterium GAS113]
MAKARGPRDDGVMGETSHQKQPIKFSADYLRGAANRPEIQSLKRSSYEFMQVGPGSSAIDIGCGPGIDTIELAKRIGPGGQVVGIDTDSEMIVAANAAAAESGVEGWTRHYLGSSLSLPFDDGTFDACRCERVLQHLSQRDGLRTISEARRVLRPGGILVFVDTDWATLSIHSRDQKLERSLAQLRLSTLRNAFAARSIKELFLNQNIEVIHAGISPVTLTVERIKLLFGGICEREIAAGRMRQQQWEAWLSALEEFEERGALVASLCMITCSGRVAQ